MIQDNFIINLEIKKISLSPKSQAKFYTVRQFYSYLMDVFDEPKYMRFDIPIEALSKTDFKLVNGWTIDKQALKHLKGNLTH